VLPATYSLVNAPALTPKTFRESLGRFNDLFAGNEQHDAQELLAFLLGGLSEDLNRIVEKPYIEAPDSDGRPDAELADIWWSNHLKREMSIVVALFTGQYKSLLTCRTCKYESARFEPYTFLQLPLPEDDFLSLKLIFFPQEEDGFAAKYCIRVPIDGDLGDVLFELARVLCNDEDGVSHDLPKDHGDNAISAEDSEKYKKRADNLAVVDMRENHISKLANKTWKLKDLQNKESGELPLLYVFELTGPPTESEPHSKESDEKPAYIAIAQRRVELSSRLHLHPLSNRVFGTPYLLRIHRPQSCTGTMLYDMVASKLRKVVPKAALRFLTPGENTPNGQSERESKTLSDDEELAAGSMPRYGFRLRLTVRDGKRCATCQWFECCVGCLIADGDAVVDVRDGDSIVVDWHFAVDIATAGFGSRNTCQDPISDVRPVDARSRRRALGLEIKDHRSCESRKSKNSHELAVTLEDCLDAFAKEERIPEAYCSNCRDFRVQMKRMSLWRLPPVVIIHLKRFQFTQYMRRKLTDLVVFPLEGLDMSRIMAQESNGAKQEGLPNGRANVEKKGNSEDTWNEDDSEKLKDSGRDEKLYDLYGVVHHQGALSGGHYVCSLKSEFDGQWRLFNDGQIYDIHARDVVDPSAYILFYIRRDAAKAQLSDFWDLKEGSGVSEADMEQMMKGRSDKCVIS